MPATIDDLYARFDDLGIRTTTVEHPAVHTAKEYEGLRDRLPGGLCRNLFLKDKKGALWLVVTTVDRQIDMKDLRRRIGSNHLSFGKADLLREVLGVEPGSVTPFALINDTGQRVRVVLDKQMMGLDILNYHPLANTASTAISAGDLLRFIQHCGHRPDIVELD